MKKIFTYSRNTSDNDRQTYERSAISHLPFYEYIKLMHWGKITDYKGPMITASEKN